MLDLPRKDKNGFSYLSYSQIQTFKRDKNQFYESYILNKPFKGNVYTDFGSKVGEALEKNDFSKFTKKERETLSKCVRLDEFEKRVKIDFKDFYLVGYIDTNSFDFQTIIDYKTGGKNKELEYKKESYTQLCYYALGLRQEYGITPKKAYVNFIRREGNAFKGEKLKVGKDVLLIDIDISYGRLKKVYWETFYIAKQIENFYKDAVQKLPN